MKISQVYYLLCHALKYKTKKDVCFSTSIQLTAGNFLDWKLMQMGNWYVKGKIVWYIKIFYLLILICEYLFGKNILWNWDSEYLRSVRHKFKLCFLPGIFSRSRHNWKHKVWGDDGFIIFWLFGKKNRRPCFSIITDAEIGMTLIFGRFWKCFFENMVFWRLVSDSIEWAHDSSFLRWENWIICAMEIWRLQFPKVWR